MSRHTEHRTLGRRSRREPIEVPETRAEDKSIDLLLRLRKQRVERIEQERNRAREAWRQERISLRDEKQRRRQAVQDANDHWIQARERFLSMVMTSGQYRKEKAIYARKKEYAAQLYLECLETVKRCKSSREAFFSFCRELRQARRQHEKLGMLRDELRKLTSQSEV